MERRSSWNFHRRLLEIPTNAYIYSGCRLLVAVRYYSRVVVVGGDDSRRLTRLPNAVVCVRSSADTLHLKSFWVEAFTFFPSFLLPFFRERSVRHAPLGAEPRPFSLSFDPFSSRVSPPNSRDNSYSTCVPHRCTHHHHGLSSTVDAIR